ncbi:MAG TPA: cytochrome P450 [Paracoccaceae bacterium]|nr:cytochrome P450 [Paracoccaceae bacterium]
MDEARPVVHHPREMLRIFRQSPRDPAFVQDPWPAYDRLRALGPAHWAELPHLEAVFAGHAEVSALLRDRRFGREAPDPAPTPPHLAPFAALEAHSLLEREPPVHTRLRALVSRAFTSRAVAALEPWIAALARDLVDRLEGPAPDLVAGYAEPLPLAVITRVLGAPPEAGPRLRAWSADMVAMYQARRDRALEDRAATASAEFAAFMADLIARRRARPGDALLDRLIAARDGEDRLSEPELVATAVLLLNAGHEATVQAIGNAVRLVAEGRIAAEAFLGPRADAAVEETLRLAPPLHLFDRHALEDVEVFGVRFRRGERAGLLIAAAGRDPAAFPAPGRADLARPNPAAHLAFGGGVHFCVGAPLARLEIRVALAELLRRHPRPALAEPPRIADRWHFHGHDRLRLRL